jgi:TRAP-type mannitol/chloroaromatic compound transport system permease small subunit
VNALLAFSDLLEKLIRGIARVTIWASLLLVLVTLFDVVSRRYFVIGSTQLQELEWHLHTLLFASVIGYAYLRDGHVRIDVVRQSMSLRRRWWLEFVGTLLFLLPYCALVIFYSVEFTWSSYVQGEGSASMTGLPHRWIIKSTLPLGFLLLAFAGLVVLIRNGLLLFGPAELRERAWQRVEAAGAGLARTRT